MGKLTSELRAALGKADCGCGCKGSGDCEKLSVQEWMDALLDERTKFLHDKGAPDPEGAMVKPQLQRIITMAQMLDEMLIEDDQLPGWVQSHISDAANNLTQVFGYMEPKSKT